MLPRAQRGRAGCYFLQHLNFEVAFSIDELSEQYVVWDADTLPMSADLRFFDATGKTIFYMNQEPMNQTAPAALAYHNVVEMLTGLRVEHPRGRNFVSHFMVFRRTWAQEVTRHVATWLGVEADDWARAATRLIGAPYLGPAGFTSGFADYELYGAWVLIFHPNMFLMDTDWWQTRHARYSLPLQTTSVGRVPCQRGRYGAGMRVGT